MVVLSALLRTPGVAASACAAALAALPIGLLAPAMLVLVSSRTGGFAAAGVVVAVLGAGTVAGMLVQGRLIDRYGARPVVLAAAALRLLASAAFVSVDEPAAMAVLALLIGSSEPQVLSALRALWPRLVAPPLVPSAIAMSTVLFEVSVLAGPLLLVALLAVGPAEWAVLGAAASAAAGSVIFAGSAASGHRVAADRTRVLGVRAMRWIVLVVAVQGFAVGAVQVTGGAAMGPLAYALLTAASLAGTVWGARRARRLPLLLVGLAAALAVAAGPWPFAIGVVVFGLVAGALGLGCFVELGQVAPAGAPTAAVTVVVGAGLAATSAGSAVAGFAVDGLGAAPLLLAVAGIALVVAHGWRRVR